MRATSESAEWKFLATNLGLEILSAACDQASSPRRPHFARFGMLLAIAAVFISIGELIYRGKRERVVLRRWGKVWWFYHPPIPPYMPFGTLPDIYGLVAGISQCICSIVRYVYCLRHADSPFKASLLPAIFLICLAGSRLSNNRMNANTSRTKETFLHSIPEVEVEGNIEQHEQERELQQQRERERELELERERGLERELEQEQELELERLEQERLELLERVQERGLERGLEQGLERVLREWWSFPFGVIDGGGCWESGNRRMGMMRESWSRFVLALRFCEWVGEESWRSCTVEASAGRKRDQASD